jgi:hypothetical protein
MYHIGVYHLSVPKRCQRTLYVQRLCSLTSDSRKTCSVRVNKNATSARCLALSGGPYSLGCLLV